MGRLARARRWDVDTTRRIGLTALSALLWMFVFSNFGDLSTLQRQNPTADISGVRVCTSTPGVVALSIGVVRTWLAGRRSSTTVEGLQ